MVVPCTAVPAYAWIVPYNDPVPRECGAGPVGAERPAQCEPCRAHNLPYFLPRAGKPSQGTPLPPLPQAPPPPTPPTPTRTALPQPHPRPSRCEPLPPASCQLPVLSTPSYKSPGFCRNSCTSVQTRIARLTPWHMYDPQRSGSSIIMPCHTATPRRPSPTMPDALCAHMEAAVLSPSPCPSCPCV